MARKLNLYEAEAFSVAISVQDKPAETDAEMLWRSLTDRRDEAMELSPESGVWFGDITGTKR